MSVFFRHILTLSLVFSLWACTQGGEFIGGELGGGGAMDQAGGPLGGSGAAPTNPDMGADASDATVVECECGKTPDGLSCIEPCGFGASNDFAPPPGDDDPEPPPPPPTNNFKMLADPQGEDDEHDGEVNHDEAYDEEYEAQFF